jgi:hypothetical protein
VDIRRVIGRHPLEEQRRSGKSVAGFAKERGLVAERLYWWQRKLTREPRKAAATGRRPV